MTNQDQYRWRRDRDGLGVWEHRGKVAVAGVGHSPVDRRWDEVTMDQTLGAYTILACQRAMDEAGVTVDDVDGILVCQSHIAGASGGSASQWAPRPYFKPALRLGVGSHADQRPVAHPANGLPQHQVRPRQRADHRRNGWVGVPGGGRRVVQHLPGHLSDRQPGGAIPAGAARTPTITPGARASGQCPGATTAATTSSTSFPTTNTASGTAGGTRTWLPS